MHQARFTLHTQRKACATQYKTVCTSWWNTMHCQVQHNTTTWNWFNFSRGLQAFTSNWPIRYNCMGRLLMSGKYWSTMKAVRDPKLAHKNTCNSSLAGDGRAYMYMYQAQQISEPFKVTIESTCRNSSNLPDAFHLQANNISPCAPIVWKIALTHTSLCYLLCLLRQWISKSSSRRCLMSTAAMQPFRCAIQY